MPIVIESDGSSTCVTGSGRGSSGSAIVSPIVTSGRPAIATISPGPASSAGTRSSASVTKSSVTRAFSIVPSARHHAICWPFFSVPWYDAAEREAAEVGRGVEVRDERLQRMVGSYAGAGRCRAACRRAASGRPRARRRGARPGRRARSRRRSGSRSATRRRRGRGRARRPRRRPPRRASSRSILLTTSTTGSRACSALRSTKRVCGSGPSLASTSRRTPSTIVRPRSTSPPKSAWPGVSMMLSLTSPTRTEVFLARIVIPFSRSRSVESMTRSFTSWFSRKEPACQSSASTSVVLPWSTWATIATLRRSSRVAVSLARATTVAGAISVRRAPRVGLEPFRARAIAQAWFQRKSGRSTGVSTRRIGLSA